MPLQACIQAIIRYVCVFFYYRKKEPNKTTETSKDKADPPTTIAAHFHFNNAIIYVIFISILS